MLSLNGGCAQYEECLDHILILNESHLCRVLKEYVEYYDHARSHQGIDQGFPVSGPIRTTRGPVRRRDVLGGVIHDYSRQPSALVSGIGKDFLRLTRLKSRGESRKVEL